MKFHLKLAALVSIAWIVVLVLRPVDGAAELIEMLSVPGVLAMVAIHAGLAALFWWGAGDPPARLIAVYVGLSVFSVRAALGIYLVLYAMQGPATMIVLFEMVMSIGLVAAMINGLPPVWRPDLRR